jgi:hypothetical protein
MSETYTVPDDYDLESSLENFKDEVISSFEQMLENFSEFSDEFEHPRAEVEKITGGFYQALSPLENILCSGPADPFYEEAEQLKNELQATFTTGLENYLNKLKALTEKQLENLKA